MIKNIIFDFGDVFINLDKTVTQNSLNQYNLGALPDHYNELTNAFEIGKISSDVFINCALDLFPGIADTSFVIMWNAILLDFPEHRFEFLKNIQPNYRCFLLSNTNALHIQWIQNDWGMERYSAFKSLFEQYYLSHELRMRKPNSGIYKYVLKENNLVPNETLFIDDTKENTIAANRLGIHTWNINPIKEDVTDLFTVKKELF
jgi:putative hydrolase of the HAD superfamily